MTGSKFDVTGVTQFDYDELKTISRALTDEDRDVFIKNIDTDMLYAELEKRMTTASRIVSMLYAELDQLNEDSTLQDYEKIIRNCGLVLKKSSKGKK